MKANLPNKPVFAINALMSINRERFEFYTKAASVSKDMNLKLLFMKYAIQSQMFISNLNCWLSAYGTVHTRKEEFDFIQKTLFNLKSVFTIDERALLLKECTRMENNAIKKYRTAITLSFFPSATEKDMKKQLAELEASFNYLQEVKALRTKNSLQVA